MAAEFAVICRWPVPSLFDFAMARDAGDLEADLDREAALVTPTKR
jgi:hypothetical protein